MTIRAASFLAGLSGRIGDPQRLVLYMDALVAALVGPRPLEPS